MNRATVAGRLSVLILFVAISACADTTTPVGVPDEAGFSQGPPVHLEVPDRFAQASPEVMALPGTVFAARDQSTGQLVFGVERPAVARDIAPIMARKGIPETDYRIRITEPIHFMHALQNEYASATLRTEHEPLVGGVQIHWSRYVCTLGFSAEHDDGWSFVTASHCTDRQGSTGDTQYNQPHRDVSPDPIGFEADDPAYFRRGLCSRGKICRYSDAARVRYEPGVPSQPWVAKTTGVNTGAVQAPSYFRITDQDTSADRFDGTIHKVGRTTGWTSGTATDTCAMVNVARSNIQLLCQTLVENPGARIVDGGDSGSPVFTLNGTDDAELVGILWGGNQSGDMFIFSPLSGIQRELGRLDATTEGMGDENGAADEPHCPGNSRRPACR